MTTAGRDDATAPGYGEGSGALAHIRPSWSSNPVAGWLVEHRGQRFDLARLLEALCLQLVEQGVPLDRVNLYRQLPPPRGRGAHRGLPARRERHRIFRHELRHPLGARLPEFSGEVDP